MLLRAHTRRLPGFIEPRLPRAADKPPAGRDWIHEIKHDGFRTWRGAMLPVCGS
jgi:bifunctional non-homologous end joining protein LigD